MILPVDGSETDKNAATKNWVSNKTNLKGDWLNFFLLLLLYTLQGFPLGLTSAIPILLQSKEDMSYQNQVKSIGCFFFFFLHFQSVFRKMFSLTCCVVLRFSGFIQFSDMAVQFKTLVGSINRHALHTEDRKTKVLDHTSSILNGQVHTIFLCYLISQSRLNRIKSILRF